MKIETFVVGKLETNCYLIYDEKTGEAACIDPGGDFEKISAFIDEKKLKVKNIFLTHGHFDHIGGNCLFDEVYMSKSDWWMLPKMVDSIPEAEKSLKVELNNLRKSMTETGYLRDITPETMIDLGGLTVRVVALPGHTEGCIGLLLVEKKILLAGDAATPQMCLFMDGYQPISVYQETLRFMESLDFEYFILGHFIKLFPKHLLKKFMECTNIIGVKRGHYLPYSILPSYSGTVYFLEMRNPEINDAICIIVKE